MENKVGSSHQAWRGGRTMETLGYVLIYAPGHPKAKHHHGRYVREHIVIAESALGHSLPPTAEVHHFNENRADNDRQNLVICENRSYHMLLHRRKRVVDAGGNPNSEQVCTKCKKCLPLSDFGLRKYASRGVSARCRACTSRWHYNHNHGVSNGK